VPPRRCRRREGFEGQKRHRGDLRFVTKRNVVNPRIGSRVKQTCTVEEEQPVEVVRDHEDGTREGRRFFPEGRRGDAIPGRRIPRQGTMEGHLWTTPREDVRLVRPDGRDSRRDGKAGVKVRRVRAILHTQGTQPGRRDLEDPGASRRSRRGAVTQCAAETTGSFSPSRLRERWVVSREGDRPVRRLPAERRCASAKESVGA
jgi:hypothetical protein